MRPRVPEHRPYNASRGLFDAVTPLHGVFGNGDTGPGAWEIAVRYSAVDLDNRSVDGGRFDDITLGVNWYLDRHVRIMANYIHSDVDGIGDADIVALRLQIWF